MSFFLLEPVNFRSFICNKIPVYSIKAAKTKTMQAISQASIAVNPSAYRTFLNRFLDCEYFTNFWRIGLYCVEDVDEHEENCDEKSHPAGNHLQGE